LGDENSDFVGRENDRKFSPIRNTTTEYLFRQLYLHIGANLRNRRSSYLYGPNQWKMRQAIDIYENPLP
jgi:hypothetical protein